MHSEVKKSKYSLPNLIDGSIHAKSDLDELWSEIHSNSPTFYTEKSKLNSCGFWNVTKIEDCRTVLADYENFTSEFGTLLNNLGNIDVAGGSQMAVTDPPMHSVYRKPLMKALNKSSIESWQPKTKELCTKLFEPIFDGEEVNLSQITAAFSTATASMILGLPDEDRDSLTNYTNMCIAPDDEKYIVDGCPNKTLKLGHRMLFTYFSEKINERKKHPGSDALSDLCNIRYNGEPLSIGSLVSNSYSLLLGANVTTPHVPATTILKIADTKVYDDWFENIDSIHRSAVEESFRWSSPASHFIRYATKELQIDGNTIQKGQPVAAWIAAANKDASLFENPLEFRLRRKPNDHIAFGFGPHLCVGHVLARQSIAIFMEQFIKLFTSIEVNHSKTKRLNSNFINGYKELLIKAKLRN